MTELSEKGAKLSRILVRNCDKPQRIAGLARAMYAVEPSDVAILFAWAWTNSESLFMEKLNVQSLVHFIHEHDVAHLMMDPKERVRLDALKAKKNVTLYRGAAKHNVKGFSWTTNLEKARWFARRNALDGKPLLVTATFAAEDLIAYFGDRGEFEVVVDLFSASAQRAIDTAKIKPMKTIEVTPAAVLAWRSQAFGRITEEPESDEIRFLALRMNVAAMKRAGKPLDSVETFLLTEIAEMEAFGSAFAEQIAENQKKLAIAREVYAAPEAVDA